MPPKYGSPEHWLLYAQSDLQLASSDRIPGVMYETLCFHSQQAAEKAIKAALLFFGISFPYTHNLGYLIDLLEQKNIKIFADIDDVVELSKYVTIGRYPVESRNIEEEEYKRSVAAAKKVVEWAVTTIKNK